MKSVDAHTIKESLMEAGLKATHPRIVVFSELVNSEVHPTAEQLFERVHVDHPSISKGTVYRILDHLVNSGLVSQVATREGVKRYDANLDEHSHIYCTKTHQIQDFHSNELNELIKDYFEQKQIENFKIKDIKLQINGEKIDPDKKVNIV